MLLVFLLTQGMSALAMAHGHSGGGHSAPELGESLNEPIHEPDGSALPNHQAHPSNHHAGHHASHHSNAMDETLHQPGPHSADGDCCQPDCECIAGHCSSAGAVAWLNASTTDLSTGQVPRTSPATLQAKLSNPFRPPIPA